MLNHLHISNYALISQLDIDFSEGFSVITGETGAGKSIILGALGLLLGQRADVKAIKAGAQKCCVEATFHIENPEMEAFLARNDIDFDGQECVVRREINTGGKSRAFINDTPVSLATLKEGSSLIIDIHSQHQNLLLNHENFLLDTLDTIAADGLLLKDYQQLYRDYSLAQKTLKELTEQAERSKNDEEFLRFRLQQLDEADLQEGEQQELEDEADTLNHAEEIKESLYRASAPLEADDGNPVTVLKNAEQLLRNIAGVFGQADELASRLESTRIELEDISSELSRAKERIDFDPERLSFVNERLSTIYDLQKRHHADSIEALLGIRQELRRQLDAIENIDDALTAQRQKKDALFHDLCKQGKVLTGLRKKAAAEVAAALVAQLQTLGMPGVRLELRIEPRTQPDITGMDSVAFLFSANKNVPLQNVADIASGGEIARLMLSLKALISKSTHLPTVVFDEIDTGVSGTIAEKMANVMQKMADNCQVLCITHLPQIAALGNRHYRVSKSEDENGTTSRIDLLSEGERIREIANMLSGSELTEAAINNAKSLLRIR